MFDINILKMMGTYSQRKVAQDIINGCVIDTCYVTDNPEHPYETAVKSEMYNSNNWITVQEYITKEEAITGHSYWVALMKDNPPKELKCVGTYLSKRNKN